MSRVTLLINSRSRANSARTRSPVWRIAPNEVKVTHPNPGAADGRGVSPPHQCVRARPQRISERRLE